MYTTNNISTESSSIDLLINVLPKILSGDSFYEKFARRLNKHRSDDLTVEAARLALKPSDKGVRNRYNKFSRMTACVALTGCLARGIRLPFKHSTNDILRACDRLVRDVPIMLKDITEWRHLQSLKCNRIQVSDPLLN
jgi:hypothetical protein